jgi:hypothetical protein
MKADPKAFDAVKKFISDSKFEIITEKEEQHCDRLNVKSGIFHCDIHVYNTGRIVVGGSDSPLKTALSRMKQEVEAGNFAPSKMLPFEIERFPDLIMEAIPDCDHVIREFITEAVKALKYDLLLAAAFLVGAASEKAICLLIDAYANAINNAQHKESFKQRTGKNKMVSKKYEEFVNSFKSCKTQPTDPVLVNDSYTIISSLFTFYRLTRNEVGHPEIVPNLDKGIVIANMAQFIKYLETIYGLIRFFNKTPIEI